MTKDDVALWGWEPIPEEQTTLSEILLEEGYQTLFVTDTLHQFRASYSFHRGFRVFEWVRGQERDLYVPRSPATDKRIEETLIGGPNASHAEEIMLQYFANTQDRRGEEDWFAPRVFAKGMELLEAAANLPDEQPFFLVVDAYDPHEPWDPPEKYANMYVEEDELQRMRSLYAGEVTLTDKWFGHFVDRMAELGLLESTLLIAFSDHGVSLGEHGFTGKVAQAIWPELKDIVFYMRHPEGKGSGKTSDFRASIHDVSPTVLGAMGIEPGQPPDGQDLGPILEGKEPQHARSHLTLGYGNYSWAEDDGWALSVRSDGEEARLYDLEKDPEMNRNVAGANPERVKRMYEGYIVEDAGGQAPPMY